MTENKRHRDQMKETGKDIAIDLAIAAAFLIYDTLTERGMNLAILYGVFARTGVRTAIRAIIAFGLGTVVRRSVQAWMARPERGQA